MHKPLIALSCLLLGLAGCGQKPADETTTVATAPPAASAPAGTGVERTEPAAAPAPEPAAAPAQAALTKPWCGATS